VGGAVPGDSYEDALFENPGGRANHWISLRLVGVKSNRAALGARITLSLESPGGKTERRQRVVGSGGSSGPPVSPSTSDWDRPRLVRTLEVWWPASDARQVFRAVEPDRFLEIREREAGYRMRDIRSFRLGGTAPGSSRRP
jgi:hypothetical protein